MAYDSQFVLAIMHNGSPVREISGKVTLPFNSEYKIRLKNKHSYLRAKARVWVDGRKASNLGDFILDAGETLDLERFLDESMTSGRRFKFVPLSDGRVNDPTDEENGIIKVEFYRERDYIKGRKITVNPWPTQPITPKPWWDDNSYSHGEGTIPCSNLTFTSFNAIKSSTTSSCNFVSPASTPDQAGATVEGGHSGQQFVAGADFQTDVCPVTLTLRMQGPKERQSPTVCPEAKPKKKPVKVRFCPECGARRMRKAKFCHRCGHPFRRLR